MWSDTKIIRSILKSLNLFAEIKKLTGNGNTFVSHFVCKLGVMCQEVIRA